MLVFVIPVKSPEVSTSWSHLSQLFERCLRSVCNQTASSFKVIVVCNEKPDISFHHPSVKYLQVDFPPPLYEYGAKMEDRSKKVVAGLLEAKELNPSHVMLVDADDCISKRIAALAEQNPTSNGWFVDRGYEYIDGSQRISVRRSGFYKMCGTFNIIRYDLFRLPEKLLPYDKISGYDRFLTGHSLAREDLESRGTPLEPLPFPGTIYIRDSFGESATLQESWLARFKRHPKEPLHAVKRILFSPVNEKFVIEEIRQEFGLYNMPSYDLSP
jgi:hypothetical protein